MTTLDFSTDQAAVLDGVLAWRNGRCWGDKQYLTVGGYAGTGKTTLVSYLIGCWPATATAALCGKAAHVLRAKGAEAQTIHSLIYVPYDAPDGRVRFRKREQLEGVRTIIIDEASMIDHLLFRDLLSFGLPVLFVGDHGQLEPIGSNPKLMAEPDHKLETIHRQAMGNPILRLAAAFREGRDVPQVWDDPLGRLRLRGRADFEGLISPARQIICGYNRTRHSVNKRIREMNGATHLVEPGEKLICLRNNKTWGIFNGQQMTAADVAHESRSTLDVEVVTDDGRHFTLPCLKRQFGDDLIDDFKSQEVALVDYGYCLTAHKAQGSEWADVLVLEQISSLWDSRRWRYTVSTRAKERLIYCA